MFVPEILGPTFHNRLNVAYGIFPGSQTIERYFVGGFGFQRLLWDKYATAPNQYFLAKVTQAGDITQSPGLVAAAVTPNGKYLYTNGRSYRIGAMGSLTSMGTNSINAVSAYGIAISPDGKNLYSGDGQISGIQSFRIQDDGELIPLSGSNWGSAYTGPLTSMVFTNGGNFLYTSHGSQGLSSVFTIQSFNRLADGTLDGRTQYQYITSGTKWLMPVGGYLLDSNGIFWGIGGDGVLTQGTQIASQVAGTATVTGSWILWPTMQGVPYDPDNPGYPGGTYPGSCTEMYSTGTGSSGNAQPIDRLMLKPTTTSGIIFENSPLNANIKYLLSSHEFIFPDGGQAAYGSGIMDFTSIPAAPGHLGPYTDSSSLNVSRLLFANVPEA